MFGISCCKGEFSMSDSGSLGDIGITGRIGRKTVANIIILNSDNVAFSSPSASTSPLSKTNFNANDGDGANISMPYAGKFTELRLRHNTSWRGTFVLQKNNVDTALIIEILGFDDHALKKIVTNVPFVAGDLFRYRVNTLTGGTITEVWAMLFGGFEVTN